MGGIGYICGPSRGRYGPPIPVPKARVRWVNGEGCRVKAPDKVRCEGWNHYGRQVWFPRRKCFLQKWALTPEELKAAVEEYDMMSLDVNSRILCPKCAEAVGDMRSDIEKEAR